LHLMIELGMGVALIGYSGLVKRWDGGVAAVLRFCGALMLLYTIYALGFYRYFSREHSWYGSHDGTPVLAWAVLALGAAGVALGGGFLSPRALLLWERALL